MEPYNTNCENANKDYIKKYDTLISMVNGYDQINEDQNLNELTDLTGKIKKIINKTLISENDFVKLKKEQNNIMNEYDKLEQIKTGDPFSKEALEFTESSESSESSNLYDKIEKKFNINIEGKPQSKNIKLSKMPLEQKLSCDGSINQYYKMPDICININTNNKSKTSKESKQKHKSKHKASKPKASKPKASKPKASKPKASKKASKPKLKTVKNPKCYINNKINNHKIF
jgi:hypothetical protein